MNQFGERLQELRGERSKSDFARFLGIANPQTYYRYEEGRVPEADILVEIANRCGTTIDWLLGRSGSDSTNTVSPGLVVKEPKLSYGTGAGTVDERDRLLDELAELASQARNVTGSARRLLLRSIREMAEELERRGT